MNEIPATPGETEIITLVKSTELELYERLERGENTFTLRNDTLQTILSMYDISTETPIGKSTYQYTKDIVHTLFDNMIRDCQVRLHNKKSVYRTLDYLQTLDLPEQRSPEWYQMRNNVLTASSLADAIGKGHFKSRDDLLIEKTAVNPKPFTTNDIIQWGVKYEPIATWFYEYMHGLSILEFGLVPHPKFPIFGASPDGIVKDGAKKEHMVGRMLEIKCPPKRVFTSEVPEHYWIQMQGQMETCDLEECDFLQVKLMEYDSVEDYIDDTLSDDKNVLREGFSSTGFPKGLSLTFYGKDKDGKTTYDYKHCPLFTTYEGCIEWYKHTLKQYDESGVHYDACKQNWWFIHHYECTLVLRDREWWRKTMPKIVEFWNEVLYYRKNGNEALVTKKEKRKRGPRKTATKNVFEINKAMVESFQTKNFLDTDSDED